MTDRKTEIEKNLQSFLAELPRLLPSHRGRFALIRHQEIVGFYDTVMDAVSAGNTHFLDRLFSVQQVIDTGSDLGYYSHASNLGAAQ